jgi:hypothetical protein
MNAKQAIQSMLDTSDMIIGAYIGDLSDADIMVRAVPGMNHIAWQLGHLIGSERWFVETVKPGSCPPLPDGFAEAHDRATSTVDDPSKFRGREEYQELWKNQRAATKAVLDAMSDADLDRTDPSFPSFAPNVGVLLSMCGLHPMMHAGQFVAVRRKLDKPITI